MDSRRPSPPSCCLPISSYREETSIGVEECAANAAAKPLNAYELATRLSYFLWSSIPDDALSASADSGKLVSDPNELAAQIDRMLADPKAVTLSSSFAKQWLALYRLDPGITFVKSLFPSFDDNLRASAQQETATFFSHLISENLPLNTLINANFTYANARLAQHYGLTNGAPTGTALVKVSLAGTPRAGLLTQASYLMGNAHPDVTARSCVAIGYSAPLVRHPGTTAARCGYIVQYGCRGYHRTGSSGSASRGCRVRRLPQHDGSSGYRYGELRRHRCVSHADNGAPVDAHGTYPGSAVAFSSAADLSQLIAQDSRYPRLRHQEPPDLRYWRGCSMRAIAMAYASAISQRAIAGGAANWKSWIAMVASSEAFRTNRPDDPQ